MRVLSWDVGIINLAYCMIDINDDDYSSWKIIDWGIINLTNRESLKCKVCQKNASCFLENEINGEITYYCKKHIPKDIIPPNKEDISKELEGKECIKCEWDGKECIKKSKIQIRNKCYCNHQLQI